MEDCLNGHAFKMPALSNHDQNNLISESQNNGSQVEVQSRSSSEFLYHINHPEDVGAVVTSFCKVIQDGENGQIKIEHLSDQDVNQDQFQESNSDLILDRTRAEPRNNHNNANTNTFEEKTTVIRPLPQDIIVSIKDENSRSSSTDEEDTEEEIKEEIRYEEIKPEIKAEEKSDQVKAQVKSQTIDDAIKVDISEPENRRSTRTGPKNRNYSYEDASDVEEDEEDDEDDEAEENDENSDDASEDVDEEDEESEDQENGTLIGIAKSNLRARPKNAQKEKARLKADLLRRVSRIVSKKKKGDKELTADENSLLAAHPKVFNEVSRRHDKRKITETRKQEIEDSPQILDKKCERMAKAIQKAKCLIVYTGAGISTAANIPDYRGPNGVWTCLDEGRDIAACDLARAEPTFTHMTLFTLFKKGKLKHIVSQNCDGLHLRSGIPRYALSEVHGNMFIEVCKQCKPMRPYLRLFDVTENTNKNKHNTLRRCHVCGNSLIDTIVHFGERGSIKWPINWDGASRAANKADVIICLGSSLKVLRRYPWLWCMDRPKKHRPKLYIVNLQWTPKDSAATCKLNGRCDSVMRKVMAHLEIQVPTYYAGNDPLLTYATPLHPQEEHTTTREELIGKVTNPETDYAAYTAGTGNGDDDTIEGQPDSSENSSDCVKSWSLDHSYLSQAVEKANNEKKPKKCAGKGKLVKSKRIDYANIMWPRDGLYVCYKEQKFEYVDDMEAQGDTPYYCDCCDPARQKKRQYSESDSEDAEDENEDASENTPLASDLDEADNASGTTSSSEAKSEKTENPNTPTLSRENSKPEPAKPGWFGKGKRKRKMLKT